MDVSPVPRSETNHGGRGKLVQGSIISSVLGLPPRLSQRDETPPSHLSFPICRMRTLGFANISTKMGGLGLMEQCCCFLRGPLFSLHPQHCWFLCSDLLDSSEVGKADIC
jgi:hypothetical protein